MMKVIEITLSHPQSSLLMKRYAIRCTCFSYYVSLKCFFLQFLLLQYLRLLMSVYQENCQVLESDVKQLVISCLAI